MSKLSTTSYQELIKFLTTENLNEKKVEDLLKNYLWLGSVDKIKAEKEKWADFWCDSTLEGKAYHDKLTKWAEFQVDGDENYLAQNLINYYQHVNTVLEDGIDGDIWTLLQEGLREAYESWGREILDKLKEMKP